MLYRITFNTGDRAVSDVYDLGTWHVIVPEAKTKEYAEALVMLGYSPIVTIE